MKPLLVLQLCALWFVALGALTLAAGALVVSLQRLEADAQPRQPRAITTEKAPAIMSPANAAAE